MKRKYRQYILGVWLCLFALLVAGVAALPVSAAEHATRDTASRYDATALNTTIYLPTSTLRPLFQSRINQAVPGAVNSAISSILSNLPAEDRGWAGQMASTVIQPSAVLTKLAPQQGGLAATIRLSLYPGDPQPIDASMIITFSLVNSTTVQVSAQPIPGSPSLVNGRIATFQIPLGQLSSVATTPNCGDSALAVNLQVPIALASTEGRPTALGGNGSVGTIQQPHYISHESALDTANTTGTISAASSTAYAEISSASLASLGSSVGTIAIDKSLSAQNIQVRVSGGYLVATSDIIFNNVIRLGVATSLIQVGAINGNLALHVLSTRLTIFQIFSFSENSYNAQIEQMLNARVSGALTGKFNVTDAAIGINSHVPCAAGDSLILTGTTNLVS